MSPRSKPYRPVPLKCPASPPARLCLLLLSGLLCSGSSLAGQAVTQLGGTVTDVATGAPVTDVTIRVEGTLLSAVTDAAGRFLINDIPVGSVLLRFEHLAYGTHQQEVGIEEGRTNLVVRLSPEAIELDPIEVVGQTTEERQRRARGSSQWVVDRQEIEEALGTSRHLGDLIRQTIPGVRLRQSNSPTANGNEVCIEFRAAAQMSFMDTGACKSPMVFLDGVPVGNPTLLYDAITLETIQEIEMLPPGEAGARYGSGSLHGVMLIETRTPGLDRADRSDRPGGASLKSFNWEQDPAGHNTRGVLLGAFAGNAVGLVVGVSAATRCIAIDDKDEVVTTCSATTTALAGLAALALPALGGALGARWAGGTDSSVGRWIPAAASAILVLVPGYAFSLSTEGGAEADIANVIGGALLAVGVPALLTVTDRLFRDLR